MFNRVCVAGTFDGLHKGHEAMLRAAFTHGKYVVIALTSDKFVGEFKGKGVSGYKARKAALEAWLMSQALFERCEILSIDDPVGPSATADIDALIVTVQNRHVGDQINTLRIKHDMKPIVLVDVPLVAADDHRVISSTRIRQGEIDSEGRLTMPDNMRDELAKPLGLVLSNNEMIERSIDTHRNALIVTVGDMTTKTLIDKGVNPSLVVIDNKVNRKSFSQLQSWLRAHSKQRQGFISGPGYIHAGVIAKINDWAKHPHDQLILEIDGEEDLLALPVLAAAPLKSVLYYGQPKASSWACGPIVEGVVEVVVSQQNKDLAKSLLAKFIV